MYIWHGMFIISWSHLFRILHSIINTFVSCVLSSFFQLFICSFLLFIDSLIYSWMHSFIYSFILSSGATAQYIINHPHYRPCSVLHMLMSGSQSSSESCFKMMGLMYIEIQYGRTVFVILLWQSFHVFPHVRPFVPSCHQRTKVEVKPPWEHWDPIDLEQKWGTFPWSPQPKWWANHWVACDGTETTWKVWLGFLFLSKK